MNPKELRAVRDHAGWTQAKMAQALGLTPNYYALLERGERPIELRVAQQIDAFARTRIDVSFSPALEKWVVAVTTPGVTYAQREHHIIAATKEREEARKIAQSIWEEGGKLGVYITREPSHAPSATQL